MRIALFNLDSLATNSAIRSFILAQRERIALVGLSPPFRRTRGGFLRQGANHVVASGFEFANFLNCNFLLPRLAGAIRSRMPGAPGSEPTIASLCGEIGIPVMRLDDVNAPEVLAALTRLDIDVIVSCYFDQILQPPILALPRLGAFNIHTSLLPEHRGPMPVIQGWASDPPSLGVTVHRIDEYIDTGATLVQEYYVPRPGETVLQVMRVLHARGLELLSGLLPAIARGDCPSRPQSAGSYESFPSRAIIRKLRRRGAKLFNGRDLRAAFRTPIGI